MSSLDSIPKFKFCEPIYVFDYSSNSWLPKSLIGFTYLSIDPNLLNEKSISSQSRLSFIEEPIKLLIESECGRNLNSELIQSEIHLNHLYEIHHYDRKRFLQSSYLKNLPPNSKTPRYIISITMEEDEARQAGIFFQKDSLFKASQFDLFFEGGREKNVFNSKILKGVYIGCNFVDKASEKTWEKFIASLYSQFRYSADGIRDQMHVRFCKLVLKSFKDLLRLLAKVYGEESQASSLHLLSLFICKGIRLESFKEKLDLEKEVQNTVYKCLISEGLLPIFIDLNTMNEGWIDKVKGVVFNNLCCMCFANEEILPWSSKFHASLTILDRYYSYTPNSLMNQRSEKDRILHENFDYYRIKVLDFFPLDEWVQKIADFLMRNFDQALEEIALLFDSKILKVGSGSSFILSKKNDPSLLLIEKNEPNIKEPNNLKEPFFIKESMLNISSIIKEEIPFELLRTNRKSNKKLEKNDQQLWIQYDQQKRLKQEQKQAIYLVLIKLMNSSKESLADPLNKQIETLPETLTNHFMTNYSFELSDTGFLRNFCSLIARTEMKKYDFYRQNCQTIVAEVVHDLHEKLKRYIDILLPIKEDLNEFEQGVYLRFASEIYNREFFDRFGFVRPCFFDARLDYYGIYVDRYLKKKIEKWIKHSQIRSRKNRRIERLGMVFNEKLTSLFNNESIEQRSILKRKSNKVNIFKYTNCKANSKDFIQ